MSARIDEDRRGDVARLVAFKRAVKEDDRVSYAGLGQHLSRTVLGPVNAQDQQFAAAILIHLLEFRHLADTGTAPGLPEVDHGQDVLPENVLIDLVSVLVRAGKADIRIEGTAVCGRRGRFRGIRRLGLFGTRSRRFRGIRCLGVCCGRPVRPIGRRHQDGIRVRVDVPLRGVLSLDEHALAVVQADRDHTVRKRPLRFLAVHGQDQLSLTLQLPLILQLVVGDLIDRFAIILQAQIIDFIQHGGRLFRRLRRRHRRSRNTSPE